MAYAEINNVGDFICGENSHIAGQDSWSSTHFKPHRPSLKFYLGSCSNLAASLLKLGALWKNPPFFSSKMSIKAFSIFVFVYLITSARATPSAIQAHRRIQARNGTSYQGGWPLGLAVGSCTPDVPVACTQTFSPTRCCPPGQFCYGTFNKYCCPSSKQA